MKFKKNQVYVYPKHGVVKYIATEKRMFKGEEKEFVVMQVVDTGMTVRVLSEKVDDIGIHDLPSKEEIDKILEYLKKPFMLEDDKWSRRYKINNDKLMTREIHLLAEVIRDLTTRDIELKLSSGEKSMLLKARSALILEFSYALGMSQEDTEKMVNRVLGVSDEYVANLHKNDFSVAASIDVPPINSQ